MFLFIVSLLLIIAGIIVFIIQRYTSSGKIIGVIACSIGVVLLASCFLISVPTGHTGIVTTFGKVEDYTFEAGLHTKSPFASVINMDNRTQKGSLEMSCFSSDIQEVNVVYTVNYQIQKNNAQNIYKTIGRDYYNTVVTPCIQEALKTVTAKYNAEDLISSRATLATEVEEMLATKLEKYNIELISTAIEDMDFTDAFTTAVENKQVAAQNKLKAETEAEQKIVEAEAEAKTKLIEAEAEAQAKLIAANAEAEANKTVSQSLTEDILYQQWLETWNGELPQVAGSDANVIIGSLTEKPSAAE